jgi:hypothetical protein
VSRRIAEGTMTADHDAKLTRLCWKKRNGGQWQRSEYIPMTEKHAAELVVYFNREEPDYEHWTEQKDD